MIHVLTASERRTHRDCMQRWAQAETIVELGELGALWLEGKIPSQPGYTKNCGPDEETKHLIPVLARLNRGGYFTCGSQPGIAPESGCEFDHWQRAAVDGFISDPNRLAGVMAAVDSVAGLRLIVRGGASWWRNDYRSTEAVTWFDGQEFTWFGARLSRRSLRFLYGDTGALDALFGAWQVTVIDEVWGRDDALWPALDRAL